MKTIFKRSFILFLAMLMAFSSLPLVNAQKDAEPETGLSSSQTAEGDNPLAAAIADAVNDRTNGESTYNILGLELFGMKAVVSCYAPANSTIVAALYDEDTGRMVSSGEMTLETESDTVEIVLSDCELPEYYYVKAFLLAEDHSPLCKAFTYERYTRRMQEFYATFARRQLFF